ncbi:MAG: relaxase/mobilization nuclease domain-containing protein [Rhizobiales bacterium]|nr:relaxase/mobilization nuclease domain-containing protein [Hyphomicrobiales bacterium]OJU33041.1 MAG: hypothetical protein BGN94_06455 [Rhizobiales bacterium 68-8]
MIFKGNQRGGARDLALHLMKAENEHIEVREIRGFVADTIIGALREAEAVSRGTKCRRFLYSLSLNPPARENVADSVFHSAVERIEAKLGLAGHPRVVVFHEKHGRRHAHCVWSRIDAQSMKAVRMSHDWRKLGDISRELFMEHGWKMPEGLIDPALRSPLSFDRKEWFQARRAGKDPRDIKAALQQCWAASDSGKAFGHALEARGYYLAKGDRRAVVAIDTNGEVYSVARWVDRKSKDVIARVGDPETLPSVDAVKQRIASLVREKLIGFIESATEEFARAAKTLEGRRLAMTERHRTARRDLHASQETRAIAEARQRADRFRRGILGLWDRITGQHGKLLRQNEEEAAGCATRAADEKQALIARQLEERQRLQLEIQAERQLHVREMTRLFRSKSQSVDEAARDDPRTTRRHGRRHRLER